MMNRHQLSTEENIALLAHGFKQAQINRSPVTHMRAVSIQPLAFFNTKKEIYMRELFRLNIPYKPRQTKEELRNLLLANDASYYRIICQQSCFGIPELIMALPSSTTQKQLLSNFNKGARDHGATSIFNTIRYNNTIMSAEQTLGALISQPGVIATIHFS